MRFIAPPARNDLSPLIMGLPHPLCSAFRFSQPLSGFLLKSSCGLFSCHWHSWGFPYRAFPLKTAPYSRRVWLPVYHVLFFIHNRRHVCSWIVAMRQPEGKYTSNTYMMYAALICSQVRSHPILVLPSMGGRYSLGFLSPSRVYHQLISILRITLSCTSSYLQANELCTSEYFKSADQSTPQWLKPKQLEQRSKSSFFSPRSLLQAEVSSTRIKVSRSSHPPPKRRIILSTLAQRTPLHAHWELLQAAIPGATKEL